MNKTATPLPFETLLAVIRAVRGALGGWGVRGLVGQALVLVLHRRLGVLVGRMDRLMARFQAGTLWRVLDRPGVARVAGAEVVGSETGAPRGFAWLVRLAGYQAAGYGSQLQAVLATPELRALLEAAPQALKILSPLCRMLGVDLAGVRPGRAAVVGGSDVGMLGGAALAQPTRKRERMVLPRGVLAAARRQGFGKIV